MGKDKEGELMNINCCAGVNKKPCLDLYDSPTVPQRELLRCLQGELVLAKIYAKELFAEIDHETVALTGKFIDGAQQVIDQFELGIAIERQADEDGHYPGN